MEVRWAEEKNIRKSIPIKCCYVSLIILIGVMLQVIYPVKAAAEAEVKRDAFRVCADPNDLPLSDKKQQGFENKIAELFAHDLGLPVEYAWWPQRIGFVRNTLRAWVPDKGRYKCDVIMGVVSGFELTATTIPYYHSTYAMVYVRGRGLDTIKSAQDLIALPEEKKDSLKIGAFVPSPAIDWLNRNGLSDQVVPYQIQSGDPDWYPGKIIQDDLVSGKLDIAFVWGPIAGFFAKRISSPEIVAIPMKSEPGIKFDYPISMGVRQGEKEWKDTLDQLIERNKEKIREILANYNVPLVSGQGENVSINGNGE